MERSGDLCIKYLAFAKLAFAALNGLAVLKYSESYPAVSCSGLEPSLKTMSLAGLLSSHVSICFTAFSLLGRAWGPWLLLWYQLQKENPLM